MIRMNVLNAIREMIKNSGKSARSISRDIGKSPNYIGATLSSVSDVGASNVAKIAEACGYELILRGHGEDIHIDASE